MSVPTFKLKNETIFVVAEAAGGIYNSNQLKVICEISEEDSAFLKVTEDERLGFMISPEKVEEVKTKLAVVGIILRHYRSQNFASPKACLGELCPKAKQDALGAALEMSPILNEKLKDFSERFSIGVNGCQEACVSSVSDDIHIVGHEFGYKIYIGGKSSEDFKLSKLASKNVAKDKIGEAVISLLDIYIQNKQEDESLYNVVERIGMPVFTDSCASFQIEGEGASPTEELDEQDFSDTMSAAGNDELELKPTALEIDSTSEELTSLEADLEFLPEMEADLPTEVVSTELPEIETDLSSILDSESIEQEIGVGSENTELAPLATQESLELPVDKGTPETSDSMEEEFEQGREEADDNRVFDDFVYDDDEKEEFNLNSEDVASEDQEASVYNMQKSQEVLNLGLRKKQKVSIKIVGTNIEVKLPSGLDFHIPIGSIHEGEAIEMQVEQESLLVENLYGKIHIKYGDLEMNIPLVVAA